MNTTINKMKLCVGRYFTLRSSLITLLTVAMLTTGCTDYLNTENEKNPPAHQQLLTLADLQATTANLYLKPWFEFHKRYLRMGDQRANNVYSSNNYLDDWNAMCTFNEALKPAEIQRPWAALYNVITQADYVLDDYAPYCVQNGICSQQDAEVVMAEARFMRAMAYYYLAIYWHDVPIVDNPAKLAADGTVTDLRANCFEDVMVYAIQDAEYAEQHLDVKPYFVGRVSKVSAQVLLSRLYLTLAAYVNGGHASTPVTGESAASLYAKADKAATAAIGNAEAGGYGLMDDYEEIFRVQNNNCKEVLFALQYVARQTTSGIANNLGAELCYRYCLCNRFGKCWSARSSYDFNVVARLRGGLSRTRGNVMLPGTTYAYLYHEMEHYEVNADGNPNDCDATVHKQGNAWTVETTGVDQPPFKKHVVGGPISTGNVAINGNSGFCTPMLRLSEAYLNQTEARLMLAGGEATSSPDVLSGINFVRQRAYRIERQNDDYGPGKQYHDYEVINLDSILQERRMEFFMEGQFWGDIVRRSFMGEEHLKTMLDYMNNRRIEYSDDPTVGCHREYDFKYTMPADVNTQIGTVKIKNDSQTNLPKVKFASKECVHHLTSDGYCHSTADGNADNLWSMMYPTTEVTQVPSLLLAPVHYYK